MRRLSRILLASAINNLSSVLISPRKTDRIASDTLRASIEARAAVNIGPSSRRGEGRTKTKAADHDVNPEATLTLSR